MMFSWIIIGYLFFLSGEKTTISRSEIQQVIAQFVDRTLDTLSNDIELEYRSLPDSVVIEKSEYSIEVPSSVSIPHKGYSGIPVEVRVNGKLMRTVVCSVVIRRFEDVCVASKDLAKNEVIRPIDIGIQRMETTNLDKEIVTSVIATINTRTKRMIKANTVIKSSMLEEIPAVNYNDNVVVYVRSTNLSIAASGIARQEGKVGDEIRVQRTGSREILSGKVIGKQTVEIIVR